MSHEPWTPHLMAASREVLRLTGVDGCSLTALRASYPKVISEKRFPVADLQLAEERLSGVGLLMITDDQVRRLVDPDDPDLADVIALGIARRSRSPDEAYERLAPFVANEEDRRNIVAWKFDSAAEASRRELGARGEAFVLGLLQSELRDAGFTEASRCCVQMSLINDALGYDLKAPRGAGDSMRLVEVKTTTLAWDPVRLFITRRELTVGLRNPKDWSLVVVDASDSNEMEVVGSINADSLAAHAPIDRGSGSWETLRVTIPCASLTQGLPG